MRSHEFDYKNYRAADGALKVKTVSILIVVGLIALLSWLGERDHQAKLDQISSAAGCEIKT